MAELPNLSVTPPEVDLSGRQLGDFRLLRRLGRGAMAEVYLAEQGSLRRQVAIKVLKSHLATDETYVKRFHNEAQAAASLVHANIVQIHDVGSSEGVHYIAQEYVQGQNLQEFMVRRGPPDVKLALAIMRQVASALHKAALAGIVHRDIKPENIMLGRSGEVKVADFGLARLTGNGGVNLTQVGITMGTPLYMSPEQVEGRTLDPRSDIYSFGVTCFQMLAGTPPFRGETALSVAVQHLKTEPQRLEHLRPDLPVSLCRIVHKMLAKNPAQRYETARDLLVDLRGVPVEGMADDWGDLVDEADGAISEMLAGAHAATGRLGSLMKTSRLHSMRRRRVRVWIAAGVVLSFLAGGAAGWSQRPAYLLAEARQANVPHQLNTAGAQLLRAKLQDTEVEAWLKSVERYFPKDERHVQLARQELAKLYLLEDRQEEAKKLFDQFADLDDSQRELRAFGLAGQSLLLTRTGRYQDAIEKLDELWPLKEELDRDRSMRQMVQVSLNVIERASEKRVSEAQANQLKKWLEVEFPPDEGETDQAG
ncbi:MAG: serine/threonine-protein kinase [Pirellulales bacterium]